MDGLVVWAAVSASSLVSLAQMGVIAVKARSTGSGRDAAQQCGTYGLHQRSMSVRVEARRENAA